MSKTPPALVHLIDPVRYPAALPVSLCAAAIESYIAKRGDRNPVVRTRTHVQKKLAVKARKSPTRETEERKEQVRKINVTPPQAKLYSAKACSSSSGVA